MKPDSDACPNNLRKLESDITMYTDRDINSEVSIKKEPVALENTTAEEKLEVGKLSVPNAPLKSGFVFVSFKSAETLNNDATINDKTDNLSVQHEPYGSAETNPFDESSSSDVDMQKENKDAPDVNNKCQESLTEDSRSQSETGMSTFSTSADVQRNSCSETDFILESKDDSAIHYSHTHEIKVNGTSTEIKLEMEEPSLINTNLMKELDPVSTHSALEFENMAVIRKDVNAVDIKIEIKEETWEDDIYEIPLESRVSPVNLQSNEKNCISDREERYQEPSWSQKQRLHTETICPGISTFSISGGCIKLKEHGTEYEESGVLTLHRYNVTEDYHKEDPEEILGPEFPQNRDIFESDYDYVSQKNSNISVKSEENVNSNGIGNNKNAHVLGLKTDEKKRFKCNICNKSFNRAGHLKEHNLFHEGKKLHKCETCAKSFTRTSDLKKHTLIHKGERVQCKICGKDFSRAAYLKTHAVIHEGKMPHKCKICDKSFTTSFTLKRHSLVHEGKRSYLCKTCNKSFTTSSYLKIHSLSHNGISSHKCEICKKSFMWASGLKKHNRIHEEKGIKLEESTSLVQDNKNIT